MLSPSLRGIERRPHGVVQRLWLIAASASLAWLLAFLACTGAVLAQEEAGALEYTIVSGDTLFEIAGRFGVTLEDLAAANGIVNVDLIEPGQTLVIPDAEFLAALPPANTRRVHAAPGDTLSSLAQRLGQDPAALAGLNDLPDSVRLFPGQPILVDLATTVREPRPLGAILDVAFADSLVQGTTGYVVVTARQPLELQGDWNGLSISFTPYAEDPLRQFAYLPVPALLAAGPYTLTVSYMSGNGVTLAHGWTIGVVDGAYELTQIDLPPERGELLQPELIQSELARVTEVWSVTSPELLWTDVFSRPITSEYATTSPFGTRRSYNGGPYASYHAGHDFGAPVGITVTAPADAVVALTEPLVVRGNAILLDHGRGIYTGYWHLDKSLVQPGQAVHMGEPIGLVGNTGLSTGAHLHWELRIYGIAVDPMQFLEEPLQP